MLTTLDSNEQPLKGFRRAEPRKKNRAGSGATPSWGGTPTSVGQRIAARRMELHLTQARVANKVSYQPKSGRQKGKSRPLSRATLAMYEIGAAEPSLKIIEAIALALDDSPGRLAFGEAPAKPEPAPADGVDKTPEPVSDTWVLPQFRAFQGDRSAQPVPSIVIHVHRQ